MNNKVEVVRVLLESI